MQFFGQFLFELLVQILWIKLHTVGCSHILCNTVTKVYILYKGATNHEIAKLFTNNYANELKMSFVDKNKIQLLSGAEKPISGCLAYNQAAVVISRILNYNK